jgi:CDP-glucose 4,6-dehydratase
VALVRDMDPQSEPVRSRTLERVAVVSGALEDLRTVDRAIVEHEMDTVVHLGAQTIVGAALLSPTATFSSNITGTWNVLEAVRQHPSLVHSLVIAGSDTARWR